MGWFDDLYDSGMDAIGLGDDDKEKSDKPKGDKPKSGEKKEEKSWFDSISWDDVGESIGDLFGGDDDKSANANTHKQPNQAVKR